MKKYRPGFGMKIMIIHFENLPPQKEKKSDFNMFWTAFCNFALPFSCPVNENSDLKHYYSVVVEIEYFIYPSIKLYFKTSGSFWFPAFRFRRAAQLRDGEAVHRGLDGRFRQTVKTSRVQYTRKVDNGTIQPVGATPSEAKVLMAGDATLLIFKH